MKIHEDILNRYDDWLAKKTKKVECRSEPGYTYPHLRWMIEEIRSGRVFGEQSHRWLGFIQGVLVREDHFKTGEERNFTRPYFKMQFHTIEEGDTLTGISLQYYRTAGLWETLAIFNGISGPEYTIYAGNLLAIPQIGWPRR